MNLIRFLFACLIACTPIHAQTQAFTGARIFDGTGKPMIENGVLIVRDGRVDAVGSNIKLPASATRIDLKGAVIIPGLVNTHGHVGGTQGLRSGPEFHGEENIQSQLALYARYGITTVFSLGGDQKQGFATRNQQDNAKLNRARLYVSGPVLSGKTPDEVRKMADEVAGMKPDILKIRVDDNLGSSQKMAPAVSQAAIDQAHKNKLRMAAHIFYLDDAKMLLRLGVDFIAHSIRDREVDPEAIALFKEKNVCLCPTLTREVSTFVYESKPAFFDDPFFLREADRQVLEQLQQPEKQKEMRASASAQRYKAGLEVASRNLKKLSDAGVRIAMGTDSGMPARFQGYFEHMEMEMMAKAGLTPKQVLMSATGDAARCMQVSGKLGTIEPGTWADFVVLDKNPLEDIRHLRTIRSVYIAGNAVPRR